MVYFGRKEGLRLKEEIDQLKQEITELQKRVVWTKTKTGLSFNRQVLDEGKVNKYFSNKVQYSSIDEGVSVVINVVMEDIAVDGGHLVITQFVKRQGDGFIVEIYQYNSTQDISQNLNNGKYLVSYQKEN